MPLVSYVSVPIVDNRNKLEGYVHVDINHPFSKLPYVTIDEVLCDEFEKHHINTSFINIKS
jgi:hypothetical protein